MKSTDERIAELEFVVTHLQVVLDDLNEVVVKLNKNLDRLERENRDLRIEQQSLKQFVDLQRSMPHEKPPHY